MTYQRDPSRPPMPERQREALIDLARYLVATRDLDVLHVELEGAEYLEWLTRQRRADFAGFTLESLLPVAPSWFDDNVIEELKLIAELPE